MLIARDAKPEDYEVACDLWRAFGADQPPPDAEGWNARYREHVVFLVDDASGDIAGYALCVPYGSRGDIRHIMVTPAWRGQGTGRQLMDTVRMRLRARACTDWRLEVRGDNETAIALYRKVGMEVLHVLVTLRMTREIATAFGATRSGSLRVIEVDERHDHALEAHFDLGQGYLARCRKVPASHVWRIGDDTLAHYRTQLAPGLSLLFPFRAATPDHAAHVVAAAVDAGMQAELEMLVVGDAAATPLVTAGATQRERMLEMGGPL